MIWLTGLSGAGKTTIALGLVDEINRVGLKAKMLDGDQLRNTMCKDLGFTRADREENVRRISVVANKLHHQNIVAVVAVIAPFRNQRNQLKILIDNFLEVFVDAPVAICEKRDTKGLYARARAGNLKFLTGIDDIYEEPLSPDVHCRTHRESPRESIQKVLSAVMQRLNSN